eukprot:gene12692-biopygen14040
MPAPRPRHCLVTPGAAPGKVWWYLCITLAAVGLRRACLQLGIILAAVGFQAGTAAAVGLKRIRTSTPAVVGLGPLASSSQGGQEGGAGVARAWHGRGTGYRLQFGMDGAGVARAWRGRGAGISCSPRGSTAIFCGTHLQNMDLDPPNQGIRQLDRPAQPAGPASGTVAVRPMRRWRPCQPGLVQARLTKPTPAQRTPYSFLLSETWPAGPLGKLRTGGPGLRPTKQACHPAGLPCKGVLTEYYFSGACCPAPEPDLLSPCRVHHYVPGWLAESLPNPHAGLPEFAWACGVRAQCSFNLPSPCRVRHPVSGWLAESLSKKLAGKLGKPVYLPTDKTSVRAGAWAACRARARVARHLSVAQVRQGVGGSLLFPVRSSLYVCM